MTGFTVRNASCSLVSDSWARTAKHCCSIKIRIMMKGQYETDEVILYYTFSVISTKSTALEIGRLEIDEAAAPLANTATFWVGITVKYL